jgi:hypothetical protein
VHIIHCSRAQLHLDLKLADSISYTHSLVTHNRLPVPSTSNPSILSRQTPAIPIRKPKNHKSISRNQTQPNGQRLPFRLDSPGYGASSKHHRCEKRQFLAIRLLETKTVEAESVNCSNADTGDDGGNGAGAGVAYYASDGGEEGESAGRVGGYRLGRLWG